MINSTQDGNGFIDRRELSLMMRFMGEQLSEAEIQVNLKILFPNRMFVAR